MTEPKNITSLTAARLKAKKTLDDALFIVRTDLPEPLWISRAGISRLEKKDPTTYDGGDLIILGVLADAYQTTVRDISPVAADQLKGLRDLLIRASRCTGLTPGQVAA
jgi:hypothetical protein